MNGSIGSKSIGWCKAGTELVSLLGNSFGKDNIVVCSPYHIQVRQKSSIHNIWIDSSNFVKYKLANQAGRAQEARTRKQLLQAISGHDHDGTDLVNMRTALELSKLIDSAKAALPLCGVSQAVFVDAGIKDGKAQIGVVQVAIKSDGEHVRAESLPCDATNSNAAERAAIEYAISWSAPELLIFCDNRSAVDRARQNYGDRVRWLPRGQNKVADRVANLRQKNRRPRKGRTRKAKPR